MNASSREKLNSVHIVGSLGIAALFAALTGSGTVFIVVAGVLIASSLSNGDIRPPRIGRRWLHVDTLSDGGGAVFVLSLEDIAVPRVGGALVSSSIRAIASKAGLSLASELEQGYGVRNPNQLTIAQSSQLIDEMKQNLAPSPA
jgi:hypothetical protein